jgi:hypothetical protein
MRNQEEEYYMPDLTSGRFALDFQGSLHSKDFPVFFFGSQGLAIQGEVELISGSLTNYLGSSNNWQCSRNDVN